MSHPRTVLLALVSGLIWSSAPATAQPLGAFRWQIQPYCNVLTLNIAQQGNVFTLDGTDDRCGAAQAASARGMAFLNQNGTIGFGVTMVQPGGTGVHMDATISVSSFNGTWRDSSGASGNFVITPGTSIGGPPRLVGASGVAPASITAIQLANGAVGASAIAPSSINSSHVVDGSITVADLLDEPKAAFVELATTSFPLSSTPLTIHEVTIAAPIDGRVIVNTSGWIVMADAAIADSVLCSIGTSTRVEAPLAVYAQERGPADYFFLPFGGTRGFDVSTGSTTFTFVCVGSGGAQVWDPSMTAIFVAGS